MGKHQRLHHKDCVRVNFRTTMNDSNIFDLKHGCYLQTYEIEDLAQTAKILLLCVLLFLNKALVTTTVLGNKSPQKIFWL